MNLDHIDPSLHTGAQKIPNFRLSNFILAIIGLAMRFMRTPKTPEDMVCETKYIAVAQCAKPLRIRAYQMKNAGDCAPALLWFHGGGYVMGKPEIDELMAHQFAREAKLKLFSVDYRLAPKNPFPAGLDDGFAALEYLISQAEDLGIDPQRIAVGGTSAGAGLAAAIVQRAYDARYKLAFQLLVYPMIDPASGRHAAGGARDYIGWTRANNQFAWKAYLGAHTEAEKLPPYAAPSQRADLSGLPPAWIGVGTQDLFHDEDVAYAARLQQAGVPCHLHIVEGAYHGFELNNDTSPLVQKFRSEQVAVLLSHLTK